VTGDRGSVLLVGVGGQGVVLASAVVADAALRAGHDVKQSEVHGMSQRGGVVSSHLRFGPRVHSPLVEAGGADAVVALEWNEGLRSLAYLRPRAPLVINLHRVVPPGACRDRLGGASGYPALALGALVAEVGDVRACDATAIARAAGSPRAANSVLLGVLARLLPFPEEAWVASLADHAPRGTADANIAAFRAGRALPFPETTLAAARDAAPVAAADAAGSVEPARPAARVPARLEIVEPWCKGRACEICVRACPEACLAVPPTGPVRVVRPEACTGCRLCELLCPDFAIVVHEPGAEGRPISATVGGASATPGAIPGTIPSAVR
jgi:indolepyruvate ferredoxin oxidoreductase beta subunit